VPIIKALVNGEITTATWAYKVLPLAIPDLTSRPEYASGLDMLAGQ